MTETYSFTEPCNEKTWFRSLELVSINIENVTRGRLKMAILFQFEESGSWSAHRYKDSNTSGGMQYDYNQ